jgi:AmmeMemoRadiSam system protein B
MSTRQAYVAGRFYPSDEAELERTLQRCLHAAPASSAPERATALVVPHAGYMYSGAIAGRAYASIQVPEHVIVLCPNHTGLGARQSIWAAGSWQLPGVEVPVDAVLARALMARARLQGDALAHAREHAIEVQLPFLRAQNASVKIVPICLAQLAYPECEALGSAIAGAVTELGLADSTLIVASTDMSHYISADAARRLDALALERITAVDARGLYDTVRRHDISMCGYVPTTVMLTAARALGAERGNLVEYGNSGSTSGDFERVVGYAGVVIHQNPG